MSLPSTEAFRIGNFCRAAQAALTKKPMKPRRTPWVFSNFSPYCLRRAMTGAMLTSLKVVRMALVCCDCNRRSARRARRRVIGTRCSVRSPRATPVVGAAMLAAAGAAADVGPAFGVAATASSLVTRPPRPEPATSAAAIPFSSRILRAAGLAVPAAAAGAAAAGAGAGAAAFGASAAGAAAPAVAGVAILAINSPEVTVSPSPLMISTRTPAPGDGTSRTTLSVSISIRISSRATASPIFFFQEASVPSATDSDNCGTWTSIMLIFTLHSAVVLVLDLAQCGLDQSLGLLVMLSQVTDGRRRRSRTGNQQQLLLGAQLGIQMVTRCDPVPGALVARLFLSPDHFGCLRILGEFLLQRFLRERIELFHANDGDVRDLLLAT